MSESLAASLAADLAVRLITQEGSAEAARAALLNRCSSDRGDARQFRRMLVAISGVRP